MADSGESFEKSDDLKFYSISFGDAVINSKKPYSCLFVVHVNERFNLQPCYLSEKGVIDEKAVGKDLLGPLLFIYSKKHDGIPISYGKLQFSKDGRIQENTGYITASVSYHMVMFRPQTNALLTATVNKILPRGNCIGLLAHNFFNISCILPYNQKVEIGEERQVKIISLVSHKKSIQIKGVLSAREGVTNIVQEIKQEKLDDVELSTSPSNEQTSEDHENVETPDKNRKRKSLNECEVISEKKAKKKKIQVKIEVEDS